MATKYDGLCFMFISEVSGSTPDFPLFIHFDLNEWSRGMELLLVFSSNIPCWFKRIFTEDKW